MRKETITFDGWKINIIPQKNITIEQIKIVVTFYELKNSIYETTESRNENFKQILKKMMM